MENELTEKIGRYLSEEMNSDEMKSFSNEIANDPILREEVELQKKTFELLEAAAYIELKEKVASLNKNEPVQNRSKVFMRVAAMLLVLIIPTYFIVSSQYSDSNLYSAYSEPYPDRITNMGDIVVDPIVEAMDFYNQEKFEKAALRFKEIREKGTDNDQIALYEAISLTYSAQADEAIILLKKQLKSNLNNPIIFEWQLILAYLANDEGDLANKLLDDFLNHNNGYQQENAENLQKDLNSFWR